MRLKWHRIKDLEWKEIAEEGLMHFWGAKVGLHTGMWSTDRGFEMDDGRYSDSDFSHCMPWPQEPRKSRR